MVQQEQGGLGVAAVGRAREVVGLLEAVGRLLDAFERLVVPAGRGASGFGEDGEAFAAVDQLAERGPRRALGVLVDIPVEPGPGERVGGLRRRDGVLDDEGDDFIGVLVEELADGAQRVEEGYRTEGTLVVAQVGAVAPLPKRASAWKVRSATPVGR
jgi:hypothetical protein